MSENEQPLAFNLPEFLRNLPQKPGVYQMFDETNTVIYVGKARSLKNRVKSYFQQSDKGPKTRKLVEKVKRIEITVTHSENEALLLESNLIKKLKPRYNVLLRDDKSYPYIFISTAHRYPRMDVHRGAKKVKGRYFGPYPNAWAVRETLQLLQKLFLIRQCKDSFFSSRTRPCLQYQINRCSAPCVEYITTDEYKKSIDRAILFLEGKSQTVIDELILQMETASKEQHYELAAQLRDTIANLRKVQEQQYVTSEQGNTDVIAVLIAEGIVCVNVLFIRSGRILGNKSYFPKVPADIEAEDVLTEFLPQYYLNAVRRDQLPEQIITNIRLVDKSLFESFLSELREKKVTISDNVRGKKAQWLALAVTNAQTTLASHAASKANSYQRFLDLQKALKLDAMPERIECFDISHSHGEATVASCVVFDVNGPLKSDYRRFNIKDITAGDDYAAMSQALQRRYQKIKANDGKLPDLLLIDGGKGQLTQALAVLEELQFTDVLVVGIAKGEGRKAEFDRLFVMDAKQPIAISNHSPAMHLIQQIRDEAHRFAITGHRQQRGKARKTSTLEGIDGVGSKRRQALLKTFGGLQGIKTASVLEIAKVPGISKALAQKIYDALH